MELTPELMLRAYANGIFPMAEDVDDPHLHWIDPDPRGIIPLDHFHIPRRLRRIVRQQPYAMRVDSDFEQVISRCGATRPGGERTWLNGGIAEICRQLHRLGYAHSVEAWQGDTLVGGLYGIALGGAFFGESMFSLAENASKIALVHLVARLVAGGFTLLDSQFITAHLQQFGAREIPRSVYRRMLADAVKQPARFYCGVEDSALVGVFLQSTSQIS